MHKSPPDCALAAASVVWDEYRKGWKTVAETTWHDSISIRMRQARSGTVAPPTGTESARLMYLGNPKHLGMELSFADPGCPYQRGTNENTNGLIRQYFPKGTDFRDISHHQVREAENLLNSRPRACLGFRTPAEVFFEEKPPGSCV